MVSLRHEALVEMIRSRPAFATEVLADVFSFSIPTHDEVVLSSNDLTLLIPTEYRADAVVQVTRGGIPRLTLIAEVQLGIDERKRRTWPVYVASTFARYGCPVTLLVITDDPSVARWSTKQIHVGEPGFVLTPHVLGPANCPVITDGESAKQSPEIAAFSAMVHGTADQKVVDAFVASLSVLDEVHGKMYSELVRETLPATAHGQLGVLMDAISYYVEKFDQRILERSRVKALVEGRLEGRLEGRVAGRVEGKATLVLAVLETRGIEVPDDVREKIVACDDPAQLESWIVRAATATKASDLLATSAIA